MPWIHVEAENQQGQSSNALLSGVGLSFTEDKRALKAPREKRIRGLMGPQKEGGGRKKGTNFAALEQKQTPS